LTPARRIEETGVELQTLLEEEKLSGGRSARAALWIAAALCRAISLLLREEALRHCSLRRSSAHLGQQAGPCPGNVNSFETTSTHF
jgi:hypothetical protein